MRAMPYRAHTPGRGSKPWAKRSRGIVPRHMTSAVSRSPARRNSTALRRCHRIAYTAPTSIRVQTSLSSLRTRPNHNIGRRPFVYPTRVQYIFRHLLFTYRFEHRQRWDMLLIIRFLLDSRAQKQLKEQCWEECLRYSSGIVLCDAGDSPELAVL